MRISALLSCAAVAPLLMAAVQPIRLQPSSPWVVDYAENSCRLVRTFGEGKDKTKFALESESPGQVDMLVIGKPLSNYSEEVPARFLPVQMKPIKGRSAQAVDTHDPAILWPRVSLLPDDTAEEKRSADESRSKLFGRPPPIDLADKARWKAMRQDFAAKATELEIATRRTRPVILETGSLGEAIKTFDECGRESLRDWGVDPDVEEKIVRPLWAPDVAKWFGPQDYPQAMLVRWEESVVKVRLLVDATGKPTKCTSLSHFKEASFNDVVCDKFMRRAHFEPAELADGTKVPSYYTNIVVFRMAH
jgi:hypothetical protein